MARPLIRVEGARELRAALKRAERSMDDLKAVHAEAAEAVADYAKSVTVPVRSGTLKGTIRPAGQARQAVVRAGRGMVPYAGVIHFGWRGHNIEPNPFLYEALDARREEVIRKYEEAVEKVADSI